MKSEFKKSVAGLTLAGAVLSAGAVQADINPSTWKNASGENMGTTPDITFAAPPEDLVPVQVNTLACNYGSETMTSTSSAPIQVKLRASNGADLITDSANDTKALADGVSVAPGACATVSFIWTPNMMQNVTEIQATIDPAIVLADSDRSNNTTRRAVSIGTNPSVPEYACQGFYQPFDKDISISNKTKRAIPVKLELFDEYGQSISDQDVSAAPVINVTFNSMVYGDGATDDAALESLGQSSDGNQLSFNEAEQLWQYNLGTKQFSGAGTYTVTVTSGDASEYTVNKGNNCSQSFTRRP